ncbi:hypothetical protein MMC07_006922, partial [Pseudocyphellaria aurata]|nr:hypothetical protein [Pseudocyphellaria aurata]
MFASGWKDTSSIAESNPMPTATSSQVTCGTYQGLGSDIFDAFDRIERINWQGQDLVDLGKYLRDLGSK